MCYALIIRPFHTPNTGKLLPPKRTQGPHITSGSNELKKVLAEPLKELLSGLEAITDVEFDINCVSPTTHDKRVKETVYNNTRHPEKCFTITVTPRNADDILSLLPQVTPLPSRSNKKKSSKENDQFTKLISI